MAELQPIIVFHGSHFDRHLGICYRICVKLLQLMCAVITHNSGKKNEVSILINDWVTVNYSVSQPTFCSPSWNLLSDLCQTSTTDVRCHYAQFGEKWSIYINKWLSYSQLLCFTAANLSAILEFFIGFVSNVYNWCPVSLRTIRWKMKSPY